MNHFARIAGGIGVAPMLAQLSDHPELWGQNPERTAPPDSPHAQSSDIWLRFRDRASIVSTAGFGEPHFAAFYPAWGMLSAVHATVFDLMHAVQAVYLGGILLTRLGPGKTILPHVDEGWHPTFLNCKAYVILAANEKCVNFCADESVVMRPGEAWLFENQIIHSVENQGDSDRIALIVTMRTEP